MRSIVTSFPACAALVLLSGCSATDGAVTPQEPEVRTMAVVGRYTVGADTSGPVTLHQRFVAGPVSSVNRTWLGDPLETVNVRVPKRPVERGGVRTPNLSVPTTGVLYASDGTPFPYEMQVDPATGTPSRAVVRFPDGSSLDVTYTWSDDVGYWELKEFTGVATSASTIDQPVRLEFRGSVGGQELTFAPLLRGLDGFAGLPFLPRTLSAGPTPCQAAAVATAWFAVDAGLECGSFYVVPVKTPLHAKACLKSLASLVVGVFGMIATCKQ